MVILGRYSCPTALTALKIRFREVFKIGLCDGDDFFTFEKTKPSHVAKSWQTVDGDQCIDWKSSIDGCSWWKSNFFFTKWDPFIRHTCPKKLWLSPFKPIGQSSTSSDTFFIDGIETTQKLNAFRLNSGCKKISPTDMGFHLLSIVSKPNAHKCM